MTNKEPLYFKQMKLGPMENFIYLLGNPRTRKALVVDPAWDVPAIEKTLETDGYTLDGILVSHGHPDHINGVADLIDRTQAKVYMHKDEVPWIKGFKETAIATENGHKIDMDDFEIHVVHTPGHTPGSVCFLVDKLLISGDTLFINGCGRTDLPGGNPEELYDSLVNKLMKMDDDITLCPGHDYGDVQTMTMKEQKVFNPYLQVENLKSFINKRQPDWS